MMNMSMHAEKKKNNKNNFCKKYRLEDYCVGPRHSL